VRVAVLGVGLIGGSVALAARRLDGVHVTGWDADPDALAQATAAGVLDEAVDAIADARHIDVWMVAVPLTALAPTVAAACAAAVDGAIVTDVGSTKHALVAASPSGTFIGGHPLAGAETSGVGHARADLFDGATWYLTPGADTSGVLFERLRRFVASLGATPVAIDAAAHDRLMAAVSHLPHILANILVQQAALALGGETLPATGPSFRDATRVAGANPPLWGQIYAANADAIGEQLDATIEQLHAVRGQLHDLQDWQQQAAERRRALLEVGLTGGPEEELRVAVPNRPGIVAELALTLGHAGIDISDMSLAPSTDRRTGVVGLWIASADAQRARDLITAKDLIVT
jgi:prephenate dehydrogenase